MSLLASAFFLAGGGPAGVALALAEHPGGAGAVARTAEVLVSGITLAVAVGSPLLAASVVFELAAALIHRATSPTQIQALIAPVRVVAILAVFAILLERMVAALGI
jgi:hypothetical protein